VTPDPAGLAAVDLTNPQSLNRYAYVMNNPTTFTDPTGLLGCPQGMPTRDCYGGVPGFWAGGSQTFSFSSPTWNNFTTLENAAGTSPGQQSGVQQIGEETVTISSGP
jgi:hypothetical protein